MTNTLYDSTNAANIPSYATLMAGYINGKWPSYYNMAIRFPTATVLTITVKAHNPDGSYVVADILDVEAGDALPAEAPGWVAAMRQLNRPVIAPYCSRLGTWQDTIKAFQGAPLPDFWVADYTGQPHLVPGSVATQWTDHANIYDISLTNGSWPLSTPIPPTPPINPPYPVGAYMMNTVSVRTDANGNGYQTTNIPFATFVAATINGSDPSATADNAYWPGYCKVQNRDSMVLVSVIGCLPNTTQVVYVATA